jgi:hypothetical protein
MFSDLKKLVEEVKDSTAEASYNSETDSWVLGGRQLDSYFWQWLEVKVKEAEDYVRNAPLSEVSVIEEYDSLVATYALIRYIVKELKELSPEGDVNVRITVNGRAVEISVVE